MKLGLFGDIHGDARALEATLEHLKTLKVDQLLCTGDLVGYGWQADVVASRIQELGIPCVRGNHDRWALERRQVVGPRGWKPADFSKATWETLAALPPSIHWSAQGVTIEIHHGSPISDTEFVTPYRALPESITQFWDHTDASVLVLGHTHLPMVERSARGVVLNPGSLLGIPGVQTSYSFAVMELPSLVVRFYDVRTCREIRRDPFLLDNEDDEPS